MRFRISLFPLMAVFFYVPLSTFSAIKLQGHVDYKYFGPKQEILNSNENWFTFIIDDRNGWNLEFHTTSAEDGFFVSTGITNEIYRIHFTRRHRDRVGTITSEFTYETGNHPATVAEGPYPADLFPAEKLIWLAFASKPYLASLETNRIPAIWLSSRMAPMAYAFDCLIDPPTSGTAYPECITFRTSPLDKRVYDAILPLDVPNTESFKKHTTRMIDGLSFLPPGQTAAVFRADQFKTISEVHVPMRFNLEVYNPGYGIPPLSNLVAERFQGTVTNVTEYTGSVAKPKIVGKLSVTDNRFRYRDKKLAINSLRYQITNQTWLSKSDPSLTRNYNAVLPFSERMKNRSHVFLLFLLFNVVMVAVILIRMWRQKAQRG